MCQRNADLNKCVQSETATGLCACLNEVLSFTKEEKVLKKYDKSMNVATKSVNWQQ